MDNINININQSTAKRFIQESHKIEGLSSTVQNSSHEKGKMIDITRDKPIKVSVRVAVPVRDHPKFNFVGKLLGPKGNSLRRLQEETLCKMAVLGRGSMRDKKKEEELRLSGEYKYSHLTEDLHVEISTFAPPAEAHARIAYALAEVRRFLVPDNHDDIRQEQKWELEALTTQTISQKISNETESSLDKSAVDGDKNLTTETNKPTNSNIININTKCDNHKTTETINELHAPAIAIIDKQTTLLHPALRGVNIGRKRPLLCSTRSTSMNPTKRTVMTFLARAKTANSLHGFHPTGPSITDSLQLITIPSQAALDVIPTNATVLQKENLMQGS